MLKPGTYRLPRAVANPTPDRRHKHDWRWLPEWRAGTEFLVVPFRHRERDEPASMWTTIQKVGHRWTHEYLTTGDERYTVLEAVLEAVPESLAALCTRLGIDSTFARWLVESGRLTPAQLERLWAAYEDHDPDESAPQGPALVEASACADPERAGAHGYPNEDPPP